MLLAASPQQLCGTAPKLSLKLRAQGLPIRDLLERCCGALEQGTKPLNARDVCQGRLIYSNTSRSATTAVYVLVCNKQRVIFLERHILRVTNPLTKSQNTAKQLCPTSPLTPHTAASLVKACRGKLAYL